MLNLEEEVPYRDVIIVGKHHDSIETEVSLTVFNIRHILLAKTRILANLLLRYTSCLTQLDQYTAEFFSYFFVIVCHCYPIPQPPERPGISLSATTKLH